MPRRAKAQVCVRVNTGGIIVDRARWNAMLKAYRERPTIKNIMLATGVGKRVARRAIFEGWPDQSLPPFVELASGGQDVHKEMAKLRESWEEAAIVQGEATRMAAEQTMAARISMEAAVRAIQVSQRMGQELLNRLENDERVLGEELSARTVKDVVSCLKEATSAVRQAIEIEHIRAGEPEQTLGIQIGILMERCTDEELEDVISSGRLPGRLVGERLQAVGALVGSETTAAEATVLGMEEETDPDEASLLAEAAPTAEATPAPAAEDASDLDIAALADRLTDEEVKALLQATRRRAT